ncbi:MAG: ATP-binding cassette domain-containing protein [Propionibacteriaceae bacterium]|nr:ATP-binding cassette domain-containing protein [Propionibacteriaceae bacterium]
MTELAIMTRGLTKTYRRGAVVAVSSLDLNVPRGGVHGFLGPNGSGKTTTIRMLLGLIHADSGTMEILGKTVPQQLDYVINDVGAIVESPKFFPEFSARKNLEILAQSIGVGKARVSEVLEYVGLTGRAKSPYKTFSLGMKQRLAIAGTMLKDPEIFIFDEPTNGLDPSGIHEIRETMRGLGAMGKTVLVSSHILHEIEQIADTVTIIGRGRLLAEGSVAEILKSGPTSVRVKLGDLRRGAQVLATAGFVATVEKDDHVLVTHDEPIDPAEVSRLLGEQGLWVSELVTQRRNLEEVFLELTASEHLTITQSGGGRARRGAAA